jgi:hypothetical protein
MERRSVSQPFQSLSAALPGRLAALLLTFLLVACTALPPAPNAASQALPVASQPQGSAPQGGRPAPVAQQPETEEISAALIRPTRNPIEQLFAGGITQGGQPGGGIPAEVAPDAAGLDPLNPFIHLFPELRRSPAPDWLQEGVRVTYYTQSASVAQAPGSEGSGGAGYAQYDLVALDQGSVVSSLKLYLDQGNGTVTPSLVLPSPGILGVGDYWIHPAALRNAEQVANEDLAVVRMPKVIGDTTFHTVRFQYQSDQGVHVWMFDQESGLMVFYRHEVGTEADTHRQLVDVTLVHWRLLELPWQGGTAPRWATRGTTLHYDGTYSVVIDGARTPLPYAISAQLTRCRPTWCEYKLTDHPYGGMGNVSTRVTGATQSFEGIWLPPQALNRLRDGQVLDRDPVTGAEVTVTRTRGGPITLTETGTLYRQSLTYDSQDGTLLALQTVTQVGVGTTVIDLQLTERR